MSYPRIIIEAALEKLIHTDLSLHHIADELGIPRATLHGWKRKYRMIKDDSNKKQARTQLVPVMGFR